MFKFNFKSALFLALLLPARTVDAACVANALTNGDFETAGVEGTTPPSWSATPSGSGSCNIVLNNGLTDFYPFNGLIPALIPISGAGTGDALAVTTGPTGATPCTLKQTVGLPTLSITVATLSFDYHVLSTSFLTPEGTLINAAQESTALICIDTGVGPQAVETFTTTDFAGGTSVTGSKSIDVTALLQAAQAVSTTSFVVQFDLIGNTGLFPFQWDNVVLSYCTVNGACDPAVEFCGDPHLTTWSDEHFDFQGECDLVLVDNPDFKDGLGMYIQARTKLHGTWSGIASAAIKIGDDVLEVHGEDLPLINGVEFPLDVKDGTEYAFPFSLGGYSLTVQQRGPHSRAFIVHLGDGERIYINNFKEFVDFGIDSPRSSEFDGAVGLLGSFTMGTKLSRDGKTIIEDTDAFGQEWQVRDSDVQLFTIKEGPQYPAKCNMPEELSAEQRRLHNLTRKVTREDAMKACAYASNKFNCISDVLSSDDLDMAHIYTG